MKTQCITQIYNMLTIFLASVYFICVLFEQISTSSLRIPNQFLKEVISDLYF
jgi:hypothetical protein